MSNEQNFIDGFGKSITNSFDLTVNNLDVQENETIEGDLIIAGSITVSDDIIALNAPHGFVAKSTASTPNPTISMNYEPATSRGIIRTSDDAALDLQPGPSANKKIRLVADTVTITNSSGSGIETANHFNVYQPSNITTTTCDDILSFTNANNLSNFNSKQGISMYNYGNPSSPRISIGIDSGTISPILVFTKSYFRMVDNLGEFDLNFAAGDISLGTGGAGTIRCKTVGLGEISLSCTGAGGVSLSTLGVGAVNISCAGIGPISLSTTIGNISITTGGIFTVTATSATFTMPVASFTGVLNVAGALWADGALNVAGLLTAQGDVNITGILSVQGDANITGLLTAQGDVNVTGILSVQGDANITGLLTAQGNANVAGVLTCEGAVNMLGVVSVEGFFNVLGGMLINGLNFTALAVLDWRVSANNIYYASGTGNIELLSGNGAVKIASDLGGVSIGGNGQTKVANFQVNTRGSNTTLYPNVTGNITFTTDRDSGITVDGPGNFTVNTTAALRGDCYFTTRGVFQISSQIGSKITDYPVNLDTYFVTAEYFWRFPATAGSLGQVLTSNGGTSAAMTWTTPTVGTVTSVGLTSSNPTLLSITSSPITTSGTMNINPSYTFSGGTPTAFLTNAGPTIAVGGLTVSSGNLTLDSGSLSVTANTTLPVLNITNNNAIPGYLASFLAPSISGGMAIAFGKATTFSQCGELIYDSNSVSLGVQGVSPFITGTSGGVVTVRGTVTATGTVSAASIQSTPIGSVTPSTGAFTTLSTTGLVTLGGGVTISGILSAASIQSTPVGSVTPSTGAFTTLSTTGLVTLGGAVTISGILSATSIQSTPIGSTTPSTGFFTTLTTTGTITSGGSVTAPALTVTAAAAFSNRSITANANANMFFCADIAANASFAFVNGTATASYLVINTSAGNAVEVLGSMTVAGSFTATSIQNTPIGTTTAAAANFTTIGATTPGTAVFSGSSTALTVTQSGSGGSNPVITAYIPAMIPTRTCDIVIGRSSTDYGLLRYTYQASAQSTLSLGTSSNSNLLSLGSATGSDGFVKVTTTETTGFVVSSSSGSSSSGSVAVVSSGTASSFILTGYVPSLSTTNSAAISFGKSSSGSEGSYLAYQYIGSSNSGNRFVLGINGNAEAFSATYGGAVAVNGGTIKLNTAAGSLGATITPGGFGPPALSYSGTAGMQLANLSTYETNFMFQVVASPYIYFYDSTGSGLVKGQIKWDGANMFFGNASDSRLKKNIESIQDGLGTINQLRPVNYKWKDTGIDSFGFLANEVYKVIPGATSGKPDAVDENGKAQYMQMDSSLFMPYAVAAIKELAAKVETLQTQINLLLQK